MIHSIKIKTEQQIQFKEITRKVNQLVAESGINHGQVLLFVPHTTAAVTINENADPDVTIDMAKGLNRLIPHKDNYRHREGNSAAHIKSSLIGPSEQLIIAHGQLLLGPGRVLLLRVRRSSLSYAACKIIRGPRSCRLNRAQEQKVSPCVNCEATNRSWWKKPWQSC